MQLASHYKRASVARLTLLQSTPRSPLTTTHHSPLRNSPLPTLHSPHVLPSFSSHSPSPCPFPSSRSSLHGPPTHRYPRSSSPTAFFSSNRISFDFSANSGRIACSITRGPVRGPSFGTFLTSPPPYPVPSPLRYPVRPFTHRFVSPTTAFPLDYPANGGSVTRLTM